MSVKNKCTIIREPSSEWLNMRENEKQLRIKTPEVNKEQTFQEWKKKEFTIREPGSEKINMKESGK